MTKSTKNEDGQFIPAKEFSGEAGVLVDDLLAYFEVDGATLNDEIRARAIKLQGRPDTLLGYKNVWITLDDLATWLVSGRPAAVAAAIVLKRKTEASPNAEAVDAGNASERSD